jgi:hypothetical protein
MTAHRHPEVLRSRTTPGSIASAPARSKSSRLRLAAIRTSAFVAGPLGVATALATLRCASSVVLAGVQPRREVVTGSTSRSRPANAHRLSSVEITMHGVAVEPRRLELAHDHADVLLAEVLFAVTRKRAGFMAKTPMAGWPCRRVQQSRDR